MRTIFLVVLVGVLVSGCDEPYKRRETLYKATVVKPAVDNYSGWSGQSCYSVIKLESGEMKTVDRPVKSCLALISVGQTVNVALVEMANNKEVNRSWWEIK